MKEFKRNVYTNEINGVENEITINNQTFEFENNLYQVLVTKEQDYINVYIIMDFYKVDTLNCLYLQDELEQEEYYKNNMNLELLAIEYYLWHKYSNNEKVLSFECRYFED